MNRFVEKQVSRGYRSAEEPEFWFISGASLSPVEIMNGGYESMIWLKDEEGREYACYIEDVKDLEKDRIIVKILKRYLLMLTSLLELKGGNKS